MNAIKRVYLFYYNGFKSMTLGKTLWTIILIKLFLMFAVLKLFFFPNFLSSKGATPQEKSEYIVNEISTR